MTSAYGAQSGVGRTWQIAAVLVGLVVAVTVALPARSTVAAASTGCPQGLPTARFADVPTGSTHRWAVDCVWYWRIAQGTSLTRYDADRPVLREQMASFLVRLLVESGTAVPAAPLDAFGDDDGSAHETAIDQLAALGIVSGRGDGSYGPAEPVTRGQMATFLVRAAETALEEALPEGEDRFEDDDGDPHEPNIDKAAAAGLATGTSASAYTPWSSVSRAQMASFLARTLELLVEREVATVPMPEPCLELDGRVYGCRIDLVAGSGLPSLGDGGPAKQAVLSEMADIEVVDDGSLYIADTFNNRIRRVRRGVIDTVAGTGAQRNEAAQDGPATEVTFRFPRGVDVAADGRIYIADTNHYTVGRVGSDGMLVTIAGGNDCCVSTGDGGPATKATLTYPADVDVAADGSVYIVDHNMIRRIDPDGIIDAVAGHSCPATAPACSEGRGYSGDGGPARDALLHQPRSLVVDDSAGSLYFAQIGAGFVVRRINLRDGTISTVASGRAVDLGPDGLYVLDGDLLLRVDPDSGSSTVVAGTAGTLANATRLAVGRDGAIFVAENHKSGPRILRVRADGNHTLVAGGNLLPYDGPAGQAVTPDSQGIVVDGRGNIIFNDFAGGTIRRLGTDGIVTTIAGDPDGPLPTGTHDPKTVRTMNISSLHVNARGDLVLLAGFGGPGYVGIITPGADRLVNGSADERLHVVAGRVVRADGEPFEHEDADHGAADGGPATQAMFGAARSMAVHPDGSVYVADSMDHLIRRVAPGASGTVRGDPDEIITTAVGDRDAVMAGGFGPGADGCKSVPGISTSLAGAKATETSVCSPNSLAIDVTGNLYFTEVGLPGITMVDAQTNIVSHLDSIAPRPQIATHGRDLYVTGGNRVYHLDPRSEVVTVIAGTGTAGYAGDGGDALEAQIGDSAWVTVGPDGYVYLMDNGNFRIRRISFVPLPD